MEVDRVMAAYKLPTEGGDTLEDLIALSMRAGVPLASLARAHLNHSRDVESTEATRAVSTLSVHLVLPLGLLVLPTFLLIAVVPLAWGIGNQGLVL
jgi:tight adherence protein B